MPRSARAIGSDAIRHARCLGHTALDLKLSVSGSNTRASHTLAIPNDTGLAGLPFFHQALVPDPAAGNRAGLVVSDAARGVVGN